MTNIEKSLKALDISAHLCIVGNTNQQQEILSYFNQQAMWIEDFTSPFHERLSVREQLKFFMKWFDYKEPLDTLLEQFGLTEYQNVKVKKLSYDEYVLLKTALAYIQEDEIVIFKDALHNLKVETIDKLLSVMPLFQTRHKVIHVLSYIDHALLLSDEVYQIKKSQIKKMEVVSEDTKEEIKIPEQNISQEINQQLTRSNVFRVSVKTEDKTIFMNPEDIDYIEGAEGKVNIYINNESFIADYTLSELEEKLKVYGFYRCHRSYIINLQKVTEMITWSKNSYSIKIEGLENTFVPLSRKKVKEMQGFFNQQTVQFTEN